MTDEEPVKMGCSFSQKAYDDLKRCGIEPDLLPCPTPGRRCAVLAWHEAVLPTGERNNSDD